MPKKRTGKLRHKVKWVWFRFIVVLQAEYEILEDKVPFETKTIKWIDVGVNEYLDVLSERGVIAQLGVM